ncbi:hypothetical protein DMB44_07910 [Thermoplasma sp. Kam2015]|uniref:hypothetical protein n=2 Tax=unclassified Thermoplasma TaxID=2684908 RepID=UPI000D89061A|nr:hypothetical protein [Thermoplasma sp. Kam2015]PYB67809.1 hypothetical protein DMB44_07910 [Thermoplasma sp. Kam2015]
MTHKYKTISGNSYDEVIEVLLKRLAELKSQRERSYRNIANSNLPDHVRNILMKVADLEMQSRKKIEEALKIGEFDAVKPESRSYQMIEHLVRNADVKEISDIRSVLLKSIKEEDDLHRALQIMSTEYSGTKVEPILRSIMKYEEMNKNQLADLYDEYVNEDYW